MRTVLVEKIKTPSGYDEFGKPFWLDRYGENVDANGEKTCKNTIFYVPYVFAEEIQIIWDDLTPKDTIISRYSVRNIDRRNFTTISLSGF